MKLALLTTMFLASLMTHGQAHAQSAPSTEPLAKEVLKAKNSLSPMIEDAVKTYLNSTKLPLLTVHLETMRCMTAPLLPDQGPQNAGVCMINVTGAHLNAQVALIAQHFTWKTETLYVDEN